MFTRIALRIAVQEALRGRTLAGDNVLDSQIGALDLDAEGSMRTDQDHPFLSVYTDSGTIGAGNGIMSLFGDSSVELVIEAGISAAMVEEDAETGETNIVGVGLPATDGVMELTLDVMMRQLADALTDPKNEWAELVRNLLQSVTGVERSRVGQVANGTRLAAHELRIRGGIISDPMQGEEIAGTTLDSFLVALEGSRRPDLLTIMDVIRQGLAGTSPDWEVVQRLLGLSNGQSHALGVRPLATDTGETGTIADVAIEIDGHERVMS